MTNSQPSLTPHDLARLKEILANAPVTEMDYYLDLESERAGSPNTLRTGIIQRNSMFEVWLEDGPVLECVGSYATRSEAMVSERDEVQRVLQAVDAHMTDQRDEEGEARPTCSVKWTYPMVFTDATDFAHGWELHSKEEVIAFLDHCRACIFEPVEPGSLYWYSLQDANGVYCRPARSHRGEIRLEAAVEERVG